VESPVIQKDTIDLVTDSGSTRAGGSTRDSLGFRVTGLIFRDSNRREKEKSQIEIALKNGP